jgi:predicted RNase H-like HicB family nuclease
LRCYAEGQNGEWEAICLDLDIAVQGRSFEDVLCSLREAIALYLETVADLPAGEQCSLLKRPAPLAIRFKFLVHAARGVFAAGDDRERHQFTMPVAA